MRYEVRYFFDPGSGICLWAKNAEARQKFGYPIDHRNLDLSENAKRQIDQIIAWFDTSIDWKSPPNKIWSEDDQLKFKLEAVKVLELIREELPPPEWEFFEEIRK